MAKKKYSRRETLKLFGTGLTVVFPIDSLLKLLVGSLTSRMILAANNESLDSKYILIQEHGAPPRWMYDLFLQPYGGQIVNNASVVSEFTSENGRYTDARYFSHQVKGVQAPIIWTHDISDSSGKTIALNQLMDNMLMLQGIDALNAGHVPAAGLINMPLTQNSLDGELADSSEFPFGSLHLGASNLDFRSSTGKSLKSYTANQDIVTLLPKAFETGLSSLHKKYQTQIDNAVKALDKVLEKSNASMSTINQDKKSALHLMNGELEKINQFYPSLLSKYENIIAKTVELTHGLNGGNGLAGFTDRPIGIQTDRSTDGKYLIGTTTISDADMRQTLVGATIPNLAKQFAVAEYAIINNLTSSVALNVSYLQVLINGVVATATNDQHFMGTIASVLYTTTYFRIVSACIIELIESLKKVDVNGTSLFDKTVIRQTSEFGRHPKVDGSGSDHSPISSTCMLLSGQIKGPIVAGNIHAYGKTLGYRAGSWGAAAPLKHGAQATTGHVISTLATLLNLKKSPSSNNPSLVIKQSDGSVKLNDFYIEKTKVV